MQNSEPNIYSGLATIRNGYMQMQWSRVQMYLVFNTIGLPISINPNTDLSVKLALSVVGIVVTICIPVTIWRGNQWMKFFNQKMAALERLDEGSDKAPRVSVFSDPDFWSISSGRFASRKIFCPVALLLTGIWAEEAIRHAVEYMGKHGLHCII